MQANQYEYLKFVRFRELDNWSARYMIDRQVLFNHKFQLNKLSSFLNKGGTITTIDDNGKYKRITVKTKNGGVCLRDIVTGKNIGTKKQWLVSEGLFIISKIDARNGAMGIIPKELNGAIVTNDFPVFNIDKGSIVPQYLLLVTTTERFVEFVQKCSSGTTNRQRVDVNDFLDVKIPLPSLSEQQALVEAYNAKIKTAEEKERRAEQLNKEIEDYLLDELGVEQKKSYSFDYEPQFDIIAEPAIEYGINASQNLNDSTTFHWGDEIKKEYRWLKFVRFKDVEEWGYDKIIGNNNLLLESTIYNNRKLGDLLETNPQTSFSPLKENDELSFIPMECISDEYGEWKESDHRSCKKSDSKGYTKFQEGDLIWARITPCMQNGKSAIVKDLVNGYGCGSTEFHILRNNNSLVNTMYVHYILRLPLVLNDAMKSFTGSAGQQRVPKSYLENLSIPLPPLEIQNTIVKHITELKEQIKQLKQEAKELRENALVEFEKEIFEN